MVKDHRAPRVKEVRFSESDHTRCRRSDRRARGSRNIDPIMRCPRRPVVDPLATVDAADTARDRPNESVADRTETIIAGQSLCFGPADFGALCADTLKVLLTGVTVCWGTP